MLFKFLKKNKKKKEPTQKDIEKSYGPIGSATAPPPEILEARRKPQYVVDPKEVKDKDDVRVRLWAAEIMKKHDSKLTDKWKENAIIATGDVEAEDVDILNIYPFKDLHWIIFRRDGKIAYNKQGDFDRFSKQPRQKLFHLMLICRAPIAGNHIVLCDIAFAKI